MTLTKKQRRILDFIREFTERRGYAPTIAEIGRHFGLTSPATVHKHLRNLEERGALRRIGSHSRALEVLPEKGTTPSWDLPLEGTITGGRPVERVAAELTVPVPQGLLGAGRTYALQVRGDAFRDACVRDGDFLVVEEAQVDAATPLALVVVRRREARLVRVVPQTGGRLRLEPGAGGGEAVVVDGPDVEVKGRVLGVLRKY